MQDSLFNTVKRLQNEDKINVEELEVLLNSDIEEVVALCKKACLKPKTDSQGSAYFTRDDVEILKKMKELYAQAQSLSKTSETVQKTTIEEAANLNNFTDKKINFLQKAKSRIKTSDITPINPSWAATGLQMQTSLQKLENSLLAKMSELLSEKMDGFDEIIVELIRSKTENENLRAQINNLNKENYSLKTELASFCPLPFGFYSKKNVDDEL